VEWEWSGLTRIQLVERLVLGAICDDFENVDQIILPTVAKGAAMCGVTVQRSDVVEALSTLVHAGMAKVYDLSAPGGDPFNGELPSVPPLDVIEEDFRTYCFVTKKGLEFHLSDPSWPFDNEGDLRAGWTLPEA
jgi:hypothetical protein